MKVVHQLFTENVFKLLESFQFFLFFLFYFKWFKKKSVFGNVLFVIRYVINLACLCVYSLFTLASLVYTQHEFLGRAFFVPFMYTGTFIYAERIFVRQNFKRRNFPEYIKEIKNTRRTRFFTLRVNEA